jgi:hypothetical protein
VMVLLRRRPSRRRGRRALPPPNPQDARSGRCPLRGASLVDDRAGQSSRRHLGTR